MKRVEYGDKLQGVDYVYTVDGKLKSINNANVGANGANDPGKDGTGNGFATDVFSQNMEYYTNDYLRVGTNINGVQNASAPGKYSGLANGIGWQTQKPSSVIGLDAPAMNIFTYDTKGQLLSNIWGTPDYGTRVFTGTTNVNQEKDISYDAHGNLLKLQRTNGAGTTVNNFTYNYQAGTNKLSSVTGYANFTYDALGQLASQVKGAAGMYLDYDVSGKVTGIYSDEAKSVIMLSFAYDESGNRIMKKDHRTNAVSWYSYDVAGTLLAVFESKSGGTLQLTEQPVYGSGRLGMLNRQGQVNSYTLTDHLGNTRAIINRNKLPGGFADVLYNADYYPYGLEARSAGIDTRYGYQGLYAEKDKETGWNNFELRNYDPAVGRWLTVDPMGQYISPYLGMGNNPVSMFDPSGGWSDGDPGKIAWRVKLDEVVVNARKSVFNSSFVKSLRNFQTNASAWAQRQSDITTQMSRTFAYVTQPSRDHIRGTLTPLYQIYGTMVSMGGGQAGYTRGWIGFAKGVEVIEDAVKTVEEVKVIENVQNVHSFAASQAETIYEIGDGVRRAKAAQILGNKTIEAMDHTGAVFQVPIENLRSPMKNSIDIIKEPSRWWDVYKGTKAKETLPPIYIQPGSRGIKVKDISLIK